LIIFVCLPISSSFDCVALKVDNGENMTLAGYS